MLKGLQGIGAGLFLIGLCCVILLLSDWHRRQGPPPEKRTVSIFLFSDRDLLEESAQGCIDRLTARGLRPGRELILRRYSANADMSMANSVAKTIAESDSAMVITFSTPALQVMAAANRHRKMPHLFGTVTDPFQSGVGLSRANPAARPAWLAGIGTFQPVKEVFHLARQIRPELRRVGVVWCTSETCSEACTVLAREVCEELGITLVEMPVVTSSEITDATRALLARNVEAIWIGGDNIVELATPGIIEMALQAGIPVFANAPIHAENGALLGLGADYYQVGAAVGDLAADVLEGRAPASIPVDNVVPERLFVNTAILPRLRDNWTIPAPLLASAAYVISATNTGAATPRTTTDAAIARRVGIFYYGPDPMIDRGIEGYKQGLADEGFVEGKNIEFLIRHAQGDASQIPQIARQFDEADLDVITPMTTPCLMAALGAVRKTPVVFTLVYDPVGAGAGADFTNHLPGVTGIGSFPPLADTVAIMTNLLPAAKKIGTIYNPSEANSSKAVKRVAAMLKECGMDLEMVTVASSAELHTAALALVQRGCEAIWITGDNTAVAGFAAIHAVARDARIPLISNDLDMINEGATVAVGFNPWHSGEAAARLTARVLRGESPDFIPFQQVSVKKVAVNEADLQRLRLTMPTQTTPNAPVSRTRLLVAPTTAAAYGLDLPPAVLNRAERVEAP